MAKVVKAITALQEAQRALERASFSTNGESTGTAFGSTIRQDFVRWASTWVTPQLVEAAHALGGEIKVDPHFASFLGEFERSHGAIVLCMCPHHDLVEAHDGAVRIVN